MVLMEHRRSKGQPVLEGPKKAKRIGRQGGESSAVGGGWTGNQVRSCAAKIRYGRKRGVPWGPGRLEGFIHAGINKRKGKAEAKKNRAITLRKSVKEYKSKSFQEGSNYGTGTGS